MELPTPLEASKRLSDLDIRDIARQILTAYAVGDLVQATEAEDAYDQGVADGQRVMAGIATVWLCIEKRESDWYRVSNLPGGPEHCYFGGSHRVLCGWHELLRRPAPTPLSDDPDDP